jgi:hypothetical protein
MGISSNDINNVMGYKMDEETSARDTIEAWQGGIGYHFSTNTYTTLPRWFEGYQHAIEDYAVSGADLKEVRVRTIDTEGDEIKGLWIEVRKNDNVVITGFSPTKFLLPEGLYEVGASNYQSFIFSKWQDGETSPYHKLTVAGTTELVAVYKSELANLRVESYDNLGNSIKGMHVTVSGVGVVANGFTPLNLKLPIGLYSVAASSYKYYGFSQWDDGSQVREANLGKENKITAYYDNKLADKLGTEIFTSCQGYQQQVADSLFKSGPIAGLLELQMRKSVMPSVGCAIQ